MWPSLSSFGWHDLTDRWTMDLFILTVFYLVSFLIAEWVACHLLPCGQNWILTYSRVHILRSTQWLITLYIMHGNGHPHRTTNCGSQPLKDVLQCTKQPYLIRYHEDTIANKTKLTKYRMYQSITKYFDTQSIACRIGFFGMWFFFFNHLSI